MKKLFPLMIFTCLGCQTPNFFPTPSAPVVYESDLPEDPKICEGGGKCGYVTTRTFAEFPAIVADCKSKKLKPQACNKKMDDMLISRLTLSYPHANFDRVVLWCQSEPLKCGLDNVEKANNLEDQLSSSNRMSLNQKEHERVQAESRAQRERTAAALKFIGQGLQNQPRMQIQPITMPAKKNVNCTSQKIGNQVSTNCSEY